MKKTKLESYGKEEKLNESMDLTPEAREIRLSSLAMDAAEKQLRDGSASAQVITHFLKIASKNYKLEIEKLQNENELLKAKADNLKSQKRTEELYEKALNAMREYSGYGDQS